MSETNVSVRSRGVELGRRLPLSEIGPTGAYLEHPVPMPVGSELRVKTDDGLELGVVVVRVCEQVAGAARAPGMFVRVVEMSGDAETWWHEHRTTEDDPVFPEAPRSLPIAQRPTLRLERSEIEAVTHEGLQRPASGLNVQESEVPEDEPGDPGGSNGAGSTLQGISAVAALAAAEADGRVIRDVASTVKMTPEQLKSITDTAPPEDGSNGESDKSKGKRKRRRKKKKS